MTMGILMLMQSPLEEYPFNRYIRLCCVCNTHSSRNAMSLDMQRCCGIRQGHFQCGGFKQKMIGFAIGMLKIKIFVFFVSEERCANGNSIAIFSGGSDGPSFHHSMARTRAMQFRSTATYARRHHHRCGQTARQGHFYR